MARKPLPSADTITRYTLIHEGGEATAALMCRATHRICDAAAQIMQIADDWGVLHGDSQAVTIEALGARVEAMGEKLMSYFDPTGDDYKLHELAHIIFPSFEVAERELESAIEEAAPEAVHEVKPSAGLPRKAIKEIEGMEMQVRHATDLFQADGCVVDLLDHIADLYKEASKAPDTDIALSALVTAESFLFGAWAIAARQESGNTPLAELTSLREIADKLSHSFDTGGAYCEEQAPAQRAAKKPAQKAARTAVAA